MNTLIKFLVQVVVVAAFLILVGCVMNVMAAILNAAASAVYSLKLRFAR